MAKRGAAPEPKWDKYTQAELDAKKAYWNDKIAKAKDAIKTAQAEFDAFNGKAEFLEKLKAAGITEEEASKYLGK